MWKFFCSNIQKHPCFIFFLHLSCFIITEKQLPPLFSWIPDHCPKLSGIWFPISTESYFHCICTTHSFLNAFILTFLVCINVCGKVQARVGQVSAETTISIFHSLSCILLCPDLNTTHMNPKGLLLEQPQAGIVKRRILWSFPASCPSWLVGQNSSQQESQNCSKLFPGCYSLLALTFYWWKGDQNE